MRFDDRFLDEIKTRVRLSEVIGRSVRLRRSGREYVGLSPFGKEKSPSFYVNDEKGFFHDFSSGKHGDLIAFLQETERLSFREAVERLAAEAGVPLPSPDPRAQAAEQRRQSLGDWLELAAKWFETQLRRPGGEGARGYLHKRALPEAEWARFGLGYAPAARTGLKDHLVSKGAQPRELVEAGLLIAPEDGGAPYDRFRDRIIFPIADARGRVVSFGGRALDPEAKAKYLNGPETALFHKGEMLYGLPEARKLLHMAERENAAEASLVVVEGYMDAIACQRADIPAVAPLGTALTEEQMQALWRLHPEPTLAFDADKAGVRAAGRAIERALPLLKPGRSFRFALISGGKDPDDVLREKGAAALKAQLRDTRPFVQALFEREKDAAEPLNTPERRAALKVNLRRLSQQIGDRDLAEQYRQVLFEAYYDNLPRRPAFIPGRRPDVVESLRTLLGGALTATLAERIRWFNASIAVGAIDYPLWLKPRFDEFERQGFGDKYIEPLVSPLLEALWEEIPTKEVILLNIKADGAMGVYERAKKVAFEVTPITFLRPEVDIATRRVTWDRCLTLLGDIADVEAELRERRDNYERALRDIKAGREPPPILKPEFHSQRGYELRARFLELMQTMHSALPWQGPTR